MGDGPVPGELQAAAVEVDKQTREAAKAAGSVHADDQLPHAPRRPKPNRDCLFGNLGCLQKAALVNYYGAVPAGEYAPDQAQHTLILYAISAYRRADSCVVAAFYAIPHAETDIPW